MITKAKIRPAYVRSAKGRRLSVIKYFYYLTHGFRGDSCLILTITMSPSCFRRPDLPARMPFPIVSTCVSLTHP